MTLELIRRDGGAQGDKLANAPEETGKTSRAKLGNLTDEVGRAIVLDSGKELTQLDLVKLKVDELIKLEDKYPGILLYAFTDIIGETEKIDFSKWEFYKKPVAGQKLKVDFKGNNAANMEIGAADMFPPAVRCITVYEDGDLVLARTSERRCGLKGRNRSSEMVGFFDKNGYIPIYTGDVVVVGGAKDAEKNIDLDYEKPFLTPGKEGKEALDEASYTKYEQSDEAKKDKDYLEKLFKENPYAAKTKNLKPDDIAAIEARNTATGIGANIVRAALMVARNGGMGLSATCCWDWSDKIYRMAGVTGKLPSRSVFSYTNPPAYSGKNCKTGGGPGQSYASEAEYGRIAPGDWIYYNNRNSSDTHGNHSAIFIEWVNRGRKLARVASGSAGVPWHVHASPVNFEDKPVTQLGKPTGAVPELPNISAIEEKYRQDRLPPTLG
ncbi:MAG: hypothetical protein WC285_00375 [Candidatus Gracilibacteria bacterium]|jgi:hypothetical protein